MNQEKLHIERFIAKGFLNKLLGSNLIESDFAVTNPNIHEPDIIFDNYGIEIGALLCGENTQKEKYANEFLNKLNKDISGKIDSNLIIKLYLQDDKETLKYKAIELNKQYTYLTQFLTHLEVERYKSYTFKEQICIAQKGLHREEDYPNLKNNKKYSRFLTDLINILNNAPNKEGDVRSYSAKLSEVEKEIPQVDVLGKYFNKSIIAKFEENKYKGDYEKQILLLHNYNPISIGRFTSDKHFYSHYKDYVFNRIYELVNTYNSFAIYDNIYFLDYSLSRDCSFFNLIDFREYTPKELTKPLEGNFHFGVDASCFRIFMDKNNIIKE